MIGPKRAGKGRQVMAEINITPFTDVVLVLLIIFMVSASFMGAQQRSLEVNLPSAKMSEKLKNLENVEVTIKGDQTVFLNGDRFSPDSLSRELYARNQKKAIDTVIVRADKGVPYERVVRIFDAVKQAGIVNVALPTKMQTSAQPR
jgi:biopolymer transport protein TolR